MLHKSFTFLAGQPMKVPIGRHYYLRRGYLPSGPEPAPETRHLHRRTIIDQQNALVTRSAATREGKGGREGRALLVWVMGGALCLKTVKALDTNRKKGSNDIP